MNQFCAQCGDPLAESAKFCTSCGAVVAPPAPASAAAAAPVSAPAPSPSNASNRARGWLITGLVLAGVALTAGLIAYGPQKPSSPTAPPSSDARRKPDAASRAEALSARDWRRYEHTRYGVILEYPADLFTPEAPPPDNSGRSFTAEKIHARFFLMTHANAFNASIDELQAEDVLDLGDETAVREKGADWYSVIGVRNRDPKGEGVARRVLLSEGGAMVHRLEIAYPAARAKDFAPIVERMARSLKVDPTIPEKAAEAAGSANAPAERAKPAPSVSAWQAVETLQLGLRAPGAKKGGAGVAFEIPAGWKRTPLPEAFVLRFDAPATGGARLRLIVETLNVPPKVSLAREISAIKSTIQPGVDNFRAENEADVEIAHRPARRLTLTFTPLDEPGPLRQEYVLLRVGRTVFKIVAQGPEREATALRAVLDHVVATLAAAE
jgi:hypothetical protein